MNTITAHQVQLIRDAHALGHPNREIAAHSGTSVATVKRWRKTLGLATRSSTDQLARIGEGVVRDAALQTATQPLTAVPVASLCKSARSASVEEVLDTLGLLGHVRQLGDESQRPCATRSESTPTPAQRAAVTETPTAPQVGRSARSLRRCGRSGRQSSTVLCGEHQQPRAPARSKKIYANAGVGRACIRPGLPPTPGVPARSAVPSSPKFLACSTQPVKSHLARRMPR